MDAIRRVRPEDMVDIVKIEFSCFKYPYSPSVLVWFYETCNEGFFVAEERGRITGYCICDPSQKEIVSIAVVPERRDKGVGSSLLEKALGFMKAQGFKKVGIHVRASNREAIKFYAFHGFRPVREVKNYYGNEDGLLMEKELAK